MSGTPYYRVDPEHTGELGREIRVFGPPGTGKTTFLTGSVRNTALQRGPHNVLVASFTTTAANELKGRGLPLPKSQIGTLHSLAYRSLDRPPLAEEQIDDWNTTHPALAFSRSARKTASDDGAAPLEATGGSTDGDALASEVDALRAQMLPLDKWPAPARAFHEKWETWKRANGLIDFTDMIEMARDDVAVAPGRPDVGFFDEVQDFTPLELSLIRSWGQHMERMVLAGDDDQCQPGSDRVLTQHGYVQLDELDPTVHRLTALDINGGCYLRRSEGRHGAPGFAFTVARRPYSGPMVHVRTNGVAEPATFTPDHRFAARWVDRPGTVVYLMRRGNHWRVGTSAMFRSVGKDRGKVIYGLGHRARIENADAAWVLSVHETGAAARLEEARVCAVYGLSQVVFRAPTSGRLLSYTQEQIDAHHDVMAPIGRPLQALADHGRDVRHPAWVRDGKHRGRHTILKVEACNLLPGWMALPVDVGADTPEWRDFTTEAVTHDGDVYSLNVDRHHTYVTNGGLITRNCIFGFKGASPEAFLHPDVPDHDKIVLSQSWRIPAAVHRAAEHWIRQVKHREDKVYLPREEEGLVRHSPLDYTQVLQFADAIEGSLQGVGTDNDGTERPATVMVLAPCAYMLDPIKHELRSRGVPFHNPYRPTRGDWNPLRTAGAGQTSSKDRLLAYLRLDERIFGDDSRPWTGEDVRLWAECVTKRGIFARGAAAALEALPNRTLEYHEVAALFADDVELEQAVTPDIDWFARNLLASKRAPMQFPIEVAKKRGPLALIDTPRVVLGTIHSVKGGQADVVYLIPDLSARGHGEWHRPGASQDGVRRQFYVGMTRARRELVVCAPATRLFVSTEALVAGARAGSA